MGGQDDSDVNVAKSDAKVGGLKSEAEDLLETYVSLHFFQ